MLAGDRPEQTVNPVQTASKGADPDKAKIMSCFLNV